MIGVVKSQADRCREEAGAQARDFLDSRLLEDRPRLCLDATCSTVHQGRRIMPAFEIVEVVVSNTDGRSQVLGMDTSPPKGVPKRATSGQRRGNRVVLRNRDVGTAQQFPSD